MQYEASRNTNGFIWYIVSSDLAASRSSTVLTSTDVVIVIREEVGVALISEGQAQDSLGVGHCVALAV